MVIQNVLPLDSLTVFVDHRENASNVSRYLKNFGVKVISKQLEVGDYIVSDRVGIERKQVRDFLSSLVNQRIFKQVEKLSQSFEIPVLIIEGNPEILYIERNIHPNAIRGVFSSIAVDYRLPIIYTQNPRETAAQIYSLARREQIKEKRCLQIRAWKKPKSLQELQEFVVSGLPSVNSTLSKRLLLTFGNPKNIFTASPEELMKVEGIGKKKAKMIWDVINKEYKI